MESDRSRYGAALERTCYNNGGILERTSYGGMVPDPDYRQSLSRSSSITSDEGIILGIKGMDSSVGSVPDPDPGESND